jgi:hypothetical protein
MTDVPNFFVVGAPKCGTTSLHLYLSQHPEIYLPPKKELHFFSRPELEARINGPGDKHVLTPLPRSLENYLYYYSSWNPATRPVAGDISPSYLFFHRSCAERIRSFSTDARILIILRNPIDKAFSQYCHQCAQARETLSFAAALADEDRREAALWSDFWLYARSSLYASSVRTYLNTFSAAKVKVLFFEDFASQPRFHLRDLCAFLGVDPEFSFDIATVRNQSGTPRSRLFARLVLAPNALTNRLRAVFPPALSAPIKHMLRNINTGPKPTLPLELRRLLFQYFEQDVRLLSELLERPVPWRDFACSVPPSPEHFSNAGASRLVR